MWGILSLFFFISDLIFALVREHILNDLNSFTFTETYSVVQHMIVPEKCTLKMNVYFAVLSERCSMCQSHQVSEQYYSSILYSCLHFLFSCSIIGNGVFLSSNIVVLYIYIFTSVIFFICLGALLLSVCTFVIIVSSQ